MRILSKVTISMLLMCLTSSTYAHSSLIPHFETENTVLHTLMHTGISIVVIVTVYLLIRKILVSKPIRLKRK